MKHTTLACLLFCLTSSATMANPTATVQPPPPDIIAGLARPEMLHALALANLVASNCPVEGQGRGEASLIGATAQTVATHMGLSFQDYVAQYVEPALGRMRDPQVCETFGTAALDMAKELQHLGGVILE